MLLPKAYTCFFHLASTLKTGDEGGDSGEQRFGVSVCVPSSLDESVADEEEVVYFFCPSTVARCSFSEGIAGKGLFGQSRLMLLMGGV